MDKPTVTLTERRASHAAPVDQAGKAGRKESTAAAPAQPKEKPQQQKPEDVSDAEKA